MAAPIKSKQAPAPVSAAVGVAAPQGAQASKAAPSTGRSFADELAVKADARPAKAAAAPDARQASDPRPASDPRSTTAKAPVAKQPSDAKQPLDAKQPSDTQPYDGAKSAGVPATDAKDAAAPKAGRTDVGSAPVLAFLSGHLEMLDPAAIPALVTGNEFLADALSTADLGAFLDEEGTVGDLLESLDLPASFGKDLEKLGVDLTQPITPNDLFQALGLDPSRALAELTILKDSVATGGLASYMKRAMAFQGKAATAAAPAETLRGQVADTQIKTDPAAGMKKPAGDAPKVALDPGATKPLPAAAVPGLMTPQAQMAVASQMMGAQGAATQAPAMTPPAPSAPAAAAPVGSRAVPQNLGALAGLGDLAAKLGITTLADFQGMSEPSDADMALPEGLLSQFSAQDPASPAPGSVHAATFDAFAMMGGRLQAADVQVPDPNAEVSTEAPPVVTGVPFEAQPDAMNRLIQQTLRDAGGAGQQQVAAAMPHVGGQKLDLESLARTLRLEESAESAPADLLTGLTTDGKAGASPFLAAAGALASQGPLPTGKKMAADDLSLASLPLVLGDARDGARALPQELGGRQGEDDEQGARDGDAGDKFSELFQAHAPGGHATKRGGETFGVEQAKAEVGMTPAERQTLMQKIVDRAAVLSKEGGGIVRLDLGSAELGRIELAVKMTNDDRIDLRIMASSDRVRDLMAAELNRLRDSLAVQQVQLGKVEVGVNGRNPGEQSFQNFGGNQRQSGFQGQREAREVMSRALPLRRASVDPGVARTFGQATNANGRIQIRA